MRSKLSQIEQFFDQNVENVYQLMAFDHLILDISINAVRTLNGKLREKPHNISNPHLLIESCEKILVGIRKHDSLRDKYCDMFNQCIVLLVSYFAASLSDLFETTVTVFIPKVIDVKLLNEEFKFRLEELVDSNFNMSDRVGELLISKKGISFQDMQSIQRAFRDYCGYAPERNADIDNIIFGQACRNVIVHSGGIVDRKLIKQISKANLRTVDLKVDENQKVQFYPDHIKCIGESMVKYMSLLIEGIHKNMGEE